jgi:transketolase
MSQAASVPETETDLLAVNALRFLAVDAVQQANSGHPGMPMGAAAMAFTLWSRHLKHDPSNPDWFDRDRFVLSAGHGSMLLYGLLHVFGYDLPMDELRRFRQWGSRTPGHPEHGDTPGVETTTGPLGQGLANGVGMALAERLLAARFNRPGHTVVDHHTYGIVSDGDLMEGLSHEAASLAGHLGLGKLIYLYDDNGISIDGPTSLSYSDDVPARFAAYGWHVVRVEDGNDLDAVDEALDEARAEHARPSLVLVRTHIGFGSPAKQDTAGVHGSPLGPEEVLATKRNLGWPESPAFHVPDAVYRHAAESTRRGRAARETWTRALEAYATEFPGEAAELRAWIGGALPADWEQALPRYAAGDRMATRKASGKAIAALAARIGNLVGGSADLTPSNNTAVPGRDAQSHLAPGGRYFHFGVRELGMAAISNGLVLHGGLRPYCGTFLVFSDYMRPAVRLSAIMRQPVIYVYTHDSIGLGEDGPTHQPVEHLAALRAIPGLVVLRPADASETSEAWRIAIARTDGPTALALTRQDTVVSPETAARAAEGVRRGGYVLREGGDRPDALLVATGSEVGLALAAADLLAAEGVQVRVVSMPSWELFEAQPQAWRDSVLPPGVTRRVAVEAGVSLGWARYVGPAGRTVSVDRFGASAPDAVLFEQFGFTPERVADAVRSTAW